MTASVYVGVVFPCGILLRGCSCLLLLRDRSSRDHKASTSLDRTLLNFYELPKSSRPCHPLPLNKVHTILSNTTAFFTFAQFPIMPGNNDMLVVSLAENCEDCN